MRETFLSHGTKAKSFPNSNRYLLLACSVYLFGIMGRMQTFERLRSTYPKDLPIFRRHIKMAWKHPWIRFDQGWLQALSLPFTCFATGLKPNEDYMCCATHRGLELTGPHVQTVPERPDTAGSASDRQGRLLMALHLLELVAELWR